MKGENHMLRLSVWVLVIFSGLAVNRLYKITNYLSKGLVILMTVDEILGNIETGAKKLGDDLTKTFADIKAQGGQATPAQVQRGAAIAELLSSFDAQAVGNDPVVIEPPPQ
jgi:hypothetical protein